MHITHEEKMQRLREIFDECLATADAKGKDYSGEADGMGNLKDFGLMGIVVRIGDKYHRMKNIIKSGKQHVKGESLRDTILDNLVYSGLGAIQYDIENMDEKIKFKGGRECSTKSK